MKFRLMTWSLFNKLGWSYQRKLSEKTLNAEERKGRRPVKEKTPSKTNSTLAGTLHGGKIGNHHSTSPLERGTGRGYFKLLAKRWCVQIYVQDCSWTLLGSGEKIMKEVTGKNRRSDEKRKPYTRS